MPVGELIAETFLRGLIEMILYGISYFTGACALSLITLGQMPLAPLSTVHEKNRGKKWWNDWSIWLCQPGGKRMLRAETICVVGFLIWTAVGFFIYVKHKADSETEKEKARQSETQIK